MVLIIYILVKLGEQVVTQWDGIKEMRHLVKCLWGPQDGLSIAEENNAGTG